MRNNYREMSEEVIRASCGCLRRVYCPAAKRIAVGTRTSRWWSCWPSRRPRRRPASLGQSELDSRRPEKKMPQRRPDDVQQKNQKRRKQNNISHLSSAQEERIAETGRERERGAANDTKWRNNATGHTTNKKTKTRVIKLVLIVEGKKPTSDRRRKRKEKRSKLFVRLH